AVAKTLPAAWNVMRNAGLEVPFSTLFADQLAGLPLTGEPQRLAFYMRLLSPDYEAAAADAPDGADMEFLAGLAKGAPSAPGGDTMRQAIFDGFANPPTTPPSLQRYLDNGRLGEAILQAIKMFHSGRDGNLDDLTAALQFLRSVGLEDTARRAAIQLLLRAG
ncbi:MAG: hypothetical protein ACPG61_10355, partial [Paracoccaceae bacterium]